MHIPSVRRSNECFSKDKKMHFVLTQRQTNCRWTHPKRNKIEFRWLERSEVWFFFLGDGTLRQQSATKNRTKLIDLLEVDPEHGNRIRYKAEQTNCRRQNETHHLLSIICFHFTASIDSFQLKRRKFLRRFVNFQRNELSIKDEMTMSWFHSSFIGTTRKEEEQETWITSNRPRESAWLQKCNTP